MAPTTATRGFIAGRCIWQEKNRRNACINLHTLYNRAPVCRSRLQYSHGIWLSRGLLSSENPTSENYLIAANYYLIRASIIYIIPGSNFRLPFSIPVWYSLFEKIEQKQKGQSARRMAQPSQQEPSISVHGLTYKFQNGASGLNNVNVDLPAGSRTLLIGGMFNSLLLGSSRD